MSQYKKGSKMAITAEEAIKAITGSQGMIATIAKRLNCSRRHVYRLRDKYVTVAEAIVDEREKMKDFAESKLAEQIGAGNTTAIIFYLKTQGKDRGYVERQEVTGQDGEPLELVFTWRGDDQAD